MMEYYVGAILLLPYDFTPSDMFLCDGSLVERNQASNLFDVIGTTYGSEGNTNFRLPNMLGLEPVPHTRYCIVKNGVFPR
jgi:microcystin-dependent protein